MKHHVTLLKRHSLTVEFIYQIIFADAIYPKGRIAERTGVSHYKPSTFDY